MIKEGKFTLVEKRGPVAKITINRPDKRNALSRDVIREMLGAFEEIRNDESIAVVLTSGAGDIAYCAGRDLSEFPTEGGAVSNIRLPSSTASVWVLVSRFSCPTTLPLPRIERSSACLRSSAVSCLTRSSRRCSKL
jgi:enoyl-CoA hydratase/carnithine racemase